MDLRQFMILIDGEDRTKDVYSVTYNSIENRMLVNYYNGATTYKYKCTRVQRLENPKKIDLMGKSVFVSGNPIYKPQEALDFESKIRIICYGGETQTVDAKDFKLLKNEMRNRKVSSILHYLKDISQYTSTPEEDLAYLKQEMEHLNFIHPESILSTYLKQGEIKKHSVQQNYIYPFRFNLSQKEAVENAMNSSVSVIEGPPGTGKTQTILNILANLIIQGKTIAVVSNNNEAIKNVADKLERENYGFLSAMLGNKKNQEHFFANMPSSQVDGWYCEKETDALLGEIKSLNTHLNNLLRTERKLAKLKQELLDWKLEQNHFDEYYKKQDINENYNFPLFCSTPNRIIDFLAEMTLLEEHKNLIHRIKLFFKYGLWNIKRLQSQDVSMFLALQKRFYNLQVKDLETQIQKCEKELHNTNFTDLLAQHQHISETLFKKHLYQKYGNMDVPKYTKKNFKKQFPSFVQHFPIILSTTYSLRHSIPENYLLDYVIIDEASQIDLITGVLAFSCCKNVVIVGDTKQLPQIVDVKTKKKLSTNAPQEVYDYFAHNILTSIISLYEKILPRVILREHYRCHPKIIEFCNQKYYNGELITYTDSNSSDHPLIIYKTAEGNHMRRITRGNEKGIYN